eukprot:CAMPEP_0174817834 /NCGR_PEP_ID=MMETSP1107-20130205/402_1 /TAXON_ID=36770 /ORGANISM="Paraphysomonas vestita, Strain GFlagA" /LENGTH=57 /DNA_ID=CAMNT_0016028911 /DNA_START=30 /DNA_END=200 /DNA_ORIENTATION=+
MDFVAPTTPIPIDSQLPISTLKPTIQEEEDETPVPTMDFVAPTTPIPIDSQPQLQPP